MLAIVGQTFYRNGVMERLLGRWATKWFPSRRAVSSGAVILRYHRIADVAADPYGLCVSPERFSEQLALIRRNAVPMQLRELVRLIEDETPVPKNAVVVTFDDGYADNLHVAKPLLERFEVPATVYITTAYTDHHREFWSDELEQIFLAPPRLPRVLNLEQKGLEIHTDLGAAEEDSQKESGCYQSWTFKDAHHPTARHKAFRTVHDSMKRLRHEERLAVLNSLGEWAGHRPVLRDNHRPLSSEELVHLAEGGLVEVGAHTHTHQVLSSLPATLQRQEISECKVYLEKLLGCPVKSFAYPYGHPNDFTQETVELLREEGFHSACSTVSGRVGHGVDLFRLPRMYVGDWDEERFRGECLNGPLS